MTQRRLMISAAMASLAIGCGTSDNGTPIGTGGDSGTIILADGAVVPNPMWDGGTTLPPSGGYDGGGAVVGVDNGQPYVQDSSGAAGLPQNVVDGLRAAAGSVGAGSSNMGGATAAPSNCADLLYPYDGTVMPGGLISPPFMFGTPADAIYVRAGYENTGNVDYQYAAAGTGEFRIPDADWGAVVARTPNLPLTLTFAFSRGGQISTCVTRMKIARGNMTGAIYYNTYNAPGSNGVGAVLRLPLGQPAPEAYLFEPIATAPMGPCIACHSVSADGSTLVASKHLYFPASFSTVAYGVTQAVQPMQRADVKDAAFGGVTPDGSAILRIGNPECTQGANAFPRAKNNFPLSIGPSTVSLVDTRTGNEIPTTGLLPDHFYWMPQFSPDGKQVVFNDARMVNGNVVRTDLAVATYDPVTKAFGAPRTLATAPQLGAPAPSRDYAPAAIDLASLGAFLAQVPGANSCSNPWTDDPGHTAASRGTSCTGPCYPAWPFFTPDGKGVIFSMVSEPDFATAFPGRDVASKSELWYADVASGKAVRLENANKAPGEDGLNNYYPTVLPVQVGGYYWLFWTSTRKFGTRKLEGGLDGAIGDGIFGGKSASEGYKKRIWVSAIIPPAAGEFTTDQVKDPSFPPFYLEGQSDTGNTRAFAALNPCKERGAECSSGLDCCTGFCNNVNPATGKGVCGDKITCAQLNEKCTTAADCCQPAPGSSDPIPECIGGFCGFTILR